MKTITVHRLSMQFDTNLPGESEQIVRKMLDEFSDVLRREFPESQPQITTDSEDFNPEIDIAADDTVDSLREVMAWYANDTSENGDMPVAVFDAASAVIARAKGKDKP